MDEYGNLQDWAKRTGDGRSGGGGGGGSGGSGGSGVGGGGGRSGGSGGAGAGAGLGGAVALAPRRRVVYGSTDLVNAEDFVMGELARLGRES